eukprot:TRINITY_DN612_c0_g1_i3.p1 TRINITY_DN612_c0_g1~~TRINITY_DN612_c0_g1_i3.p1  ORF type:complete len:323 (-),score=55.30 TRINITY_DN612_c0_g1_i3:1442-2410(-)
MELLDHLQTCHGKFAFKLIDVGKSKTRRGKSGKDDSTIIQLKLQHGEQAALISSDGVSHAYNLESVYYNSSGFHNPVRKRARTNPSPSHCTILLREPEKKVSLAEDTQEKTPEAGEKKQLVKAEDADYRPTKNNKRTTDTKKKKKTGKPAFKSLSAAVQEKRLYNSVVQHELQVEEYENGADSDAESEDQEELKWRLRVVDDEIEEFVDTIAVEKLFMNLWNQFVKMEHPIKSDREIAQACLDFVQKYRKTLIRYNLEVTFLRHLTEFTRMGLLDATSVFDIFQVLRNRDLSGPSDGSDEPTFLYAERLKSEGPRGKRIRYA